MSRVRGCGSRMGSHSNRISRLRGSRENRAEEGIIFLLVIWILSIQLMMLQELSGLPGADSHDVSLKVGKNLWVVLSIS